ncbi:glyoxylate/hydroxypyruvate reductase HPR3-like [Salvia miltiorrhiza]|uniref:glyoxylate/hydroxypyruvate reductase HPR3-like n=1 Tax=Salvia miltiorrhiza TaxID=226208 RepID=UPI0025ACEA7B|nr:glyoxylate/hydroxypyruvate reductase HPR3-like [Salvia miltiorrhiza]
MAHRRDEPPMSGSEPPMSGSEPPQLLIIRPSNLFRAHQDGFSAKFNVLKAYESPLPTETFLREHAQSAKAILCFKGSPITGDLLRHLPSLGLVVTSGTGVNHIDLAACRRRGILVANTADVFSVDTADYAVGLLIAVMRKISSGDRFVRRRLWSLSHEEFPLGFKLRDKRVGIVGLGNIGSKVAKRLDAFGCKISYNSRSQKPRVPYNFCPTPHELASQSDILLICCPLTEDTRHMINNDVMNALGEEGVIVNIGRGAIIEEDALVKHLVARRIAGAALDVFENEPRVPVELFEMDNVVLSPHRGSYTKEGYFDAFRIVVENLESFFLNKPLVSPVRIEE